MAVKEGLYYLNRMGPDVGVELKFSQNDDWMNKILEELQEEVGADEIISPSWIPVISFDGEITRKSSGKYGEYLTLGGKLKAKYFTRCVKSGRAMMDYLDVEIHTMALDDSNREKFGYEDEISLYMEDREYDLYFYEMNKWDIRPILHEHVFLNKNPYPSADEDRG